MVKWTPEKNAFILSLKDVCSREEIAVAYLNRFNEYASADAITKQLYRLKRNGKVGYKNLEALAKNLEALANDTSLPFSEVPETLKGDALLDYVELAGEKCRKFEYSREHIKSNIKVDQEWIAVVCSGDWHVENQNVLFNKLRNDLTLIGDTKGAYYVFMGDETDNFIPAGKHMGGSNEAVVPPRMARATAKACFDLLNNKTLAMISGCHAKWSINADDYDFLEDLSKEIQVPFLGSGGTIDITAGNVEYRFYARHKPQFSSGDNPLHACRSYLRRRDSSCDVIAMAHHHVAAYGCDYFQNRNIILLRTGTYKPTDRYISSLGFHTHIDTCTIPCVLLNTKSKQVRAVADLSEAMDYMHYLNSRK
jgi:hypothetical protein